MSLILILILVSIIILFVSNYNHRKIRLITISLVGIFLIHISCLIYLLAFSNYNINNTLDMSTYTLLNTLNIGIIENSTIYNVGLLIIMLSYVYAGKMMGLYKNGILLCLSIPAILIFVLLHEEICYKIQLASLLDPKRELKYLIYLLQNPWILRVILLGYMVIPVIGTIKYYGISKSITNRKNGLVVGCCYLIMNIYIFAVFMFGVFENFWISNINLYKMPQNSREVISESVVFKTLFVLLVFMLVLCVTFRPFNSFAIISKYLDMYQTFQLSKNTHFLLHSLKNDIFTISLLTEEGLSNVNKDSEIVKTALCDIDDIAKNSLYSLSTLINYIKRKSVNYQWISLKECIFEAVDLSGFTGNIGFSIEGEEQQTLYCDRNLLKEAFLNLIKNAVEAMHARLSEASDGTYSPELTISYWIEEDILCIIFEDNGLGISKRDIHHIFKDFYSTKPDVKNYGVGLSYVRRIAKVHRGNVYVKSKVREYTKFFFEIPVKRG